MAIITFQDITASQEVRAYIRGADASLGALGYTEHSFAHVTKVAQEAADILAQLGYDDHTIELAKIAGYMHDIGNVVNRVNHALSGALMAFQILGRMGMSAEDIAMVTSAIGHHDEGTAYPVNPIAAAIILADKSDVRRSRVRNRDETSFDIHDRVNYAVQKSSLLMDITAHTITLTISIDTGICAVMDYFEIFLDRMMLSKRAADELGLSFKLEINGTQFL